MKWCAINTRAIAACALATTFAACGSPAGTGNIAAVPLAQTRDASWTSPQAASEDLLYVTNLHDVSIYSYPQGQLVGTITNLYKPYGECVDASGKVYVTDSLGFIYKYAHGGHVRIATYKDPSYTPYGCAIDPTTGNLAVANYEQTNSDYSGNVVIYTNPKNPPAAYVGPNLYYYFFLAYDGSGNLYVDGERIGGFGFTFGVLHKKEFAIKDVLLPQSITAPGGVGWDGSHVMVGDQTGAAVYEYTIKGTRATFVNTTPLSGTNGQVYQFGLFGSTLVAPVFFSGSVFGLVQYYNYPAGGSPTQTITQNLDFPVDAVVSPAATPTPRAPSLPR